MLYIDRVEDKMGVKKIYTEIMHFHNKTYMPHPSTRNPATGVMTVTILVDPSLVIITIYLVCLGVEKKIFK